MNKKIYLSLVVILLISLSFRFYINHFLLLKQLPQSPSINIPWGLILLSGLINVVLIFNICRRWVNSEVGLLASLLYAISPWTAYLEIGANPYILLLTITLILYSGAQIFNISKKISLILTLLIIIIFIYIFNQFTIFSNIGLLNSVNEYRGETSQTVFAPIGKVIENKYIYFSEHLLFNILKQFTPSTYFTNQARLLGFSFTPPIFLGFIISFLFGLGKLIKSLSKIRITEFLLVFLLLLPSILSKNSPDLSRLVLIAPIFFAIVACGIWESVLNHKKKIFAFLLLLTIFIVGLQFFTTLPDIAVREPVRLQMFLGQR